MKKIIITLLISAMTLCVYAADFTDMKGYDWAQEAVAGLAEKGIINGMSAEIYAPEENVTREQLAKMALLSFGGGEEPAENPSFFDVAPDRWSYEYIEKTKEWFEAEGGLFKPTEPAPRQQVVSVVVRALELTAEKMADFADKSAMTEKELADASAATEHGIITGYPDGSFRPDKNVTRAEVAVILHRAIKVKEEIEKPLPEETPTLAPTPIPEPTPTPEDAPDEEELDVRMDFYVITKVVDVYENDTETVKLMGYNNGQEVEFTCERAKIFNADGDRDDTITFAPGDVAMAIRDITTNVRWIVKWFDINSVYSGKTVINPYENVKIAYKGYLDYSFGLARRVTPKSINLVLDDTVSDHNDANSLIAPVNENTNYYWYDSAKKKVKLADISDITADRNPSANVFTDEGSFVLMLQQDGRVRDVLIIDNKE